MIAALIGLVLSGCDNQSSQSAEDKSAPESQTQTEPQTQIEQVQDQSQMQVEHPDPDEMSEEIMDSMQVSLFDTPWQGTKVTDANGNDLTKENSNYIGLARYGELGDYEFFDKDTGESRDDYGYYFVTNDGEKRILISESKNYAAIVDMVKLDQNVFTYKRAGQNANGEPVNVLVEHKPYLGKFDLEFTKDHSFKHQTGQIITTEDGADILAGALWQGTRVVNDEDEDVTQYNQNFIGLARYDSSTNRYEFFDKATGESRGDYGYYSVLHNNKLRVILSQGKKYQSAVELTELNPDKFTYRVMGKGADNKPAWVTVEHVPYKGDFKLEFTHDE